MKKVSIIITLIALIYSLSTNAQSIVINKNNGNKVVMSKASVNNVTFSTESKDSLDYYTKSEVEALVSDSISKAIPQIDTNDYYSKEQVDSLISNAVAKAISQIDRNNYYSKEQVDSMYQKMQRAFLVTQTGILDKIVASGVQNGHEYVDLGLPSGTKWATVNIGADTPEDFGNYYSWGESSNKNNYSWATYSWKVSGQVTNGVESIPLEENGTIKSLSKTVDTATNLWGGEWRMPTLEEWKELIDNCTSYAVKLNGVAGRAFLGSNGNMIFIGAPGYRYSNSYSSDYGYYWTSVQSSETYAHHALIPTSKTSTPSTSTTYKYYGCTIRPVFK